MGVPSLNDLTVNGSLNTTNQTIQCIFVVVVGVVTGRARRSDERVPSASDGGGRESAYRVRQSVERLGDGNLAATRGPRHAQAHRGRPVGSAICKNRVVSIYTRASSYPRPPHLCPNTVVDCVGKPRILIQCPCLLAMLP